MSKNDLSQSLLSNANTDDMTRERKETWLDRSITKIRSQIDKQRESSSIKQEQWIAYISERNLIPINLPLNPDNESIIAKLREHIFINIPIKVKEKNKEYQEDKIEEDKKEDEENSKKYVKGEVTITVNHERNEIKLQDKDKGYCEVLCQWIDYKQLHLQKHYILEMPNTLPKSIQETLDLIPNISPKLKNRMRRYEISRMNAEISIEDPTNCFQDIAYLASWFGPLMSAVTYYSDIWATIQFFMNSFYWYGSTMIFFWILMMWAKSQKYSEINGKSNKIYTFLGIDLLIFRAQEFYDNFGADEYTEVKFLELCLKTIPKLGLFMHQIAYQSIELEQPLELMWIFPAILTFINLLPSLSSLTNILVYLFPDEDGFDDEDARYSTVFTPYMFIQITWKLIIYSTYAILHRPGAIWLISLVPGILFTFCSCAFFAIYSSRGLSAIIYLLFFSYLLPMLPIVDPFSIFGIFAIFNIQDHWEQISEIQHFSTIVNVGIVTFYIHQAISVLIVLFMGYKILKNKTQERRGDSVQKVESYVEQEDDSLNL